jgi:sugar phosphate isomerase/epimerase
MLLGYNTNGFTSHSLADALTVIAGIGYRSVGLTLDHHAINPFRPDWTLESGRCRDLLRRLDLVAVVETGARYLLDPWRKHYPTLLDEHPSRRRRREDFLERAIDIAADLGAPAVSLWSGALPAGSSEEVGMTRLIGALERLTEYAGVRGVAVALEPEPGMLIASMSDYTRLLAQIKHPSLKLTLDVGHAYLSEDGDVCDVVRRFAPHIVNVHLEGMTRPRHDHLPPWDGELDVAAVIRTLVEVGYDGPATYELSRHSHEVVDVARRAFSFAQDAVARAASSY